MNDPLAKKRPEKLGIIDQPIDQLWWLDRFAVSQIAEVPVVLIRLPFAHFSTRSNNEAMRLITHQFLHN